MATVIFIKESKQTPSAMRGCIRYCVQEKKTVDENGRQYPRNPDLHRGVRNRQACRHRGMTGHWQSEIYLRAGGEKRSSLLLSDLQS